MSEELRTSFTWDVTGVEQGETRIEKAFSRLDVAEQKAVTAQQARAAQAARIQQRAQEKQIADQQRQFLNNARAIEAMEKEAAARRVKITEDAYARMNKAERDRMLLLRQNIRTVQSLAPSALSRVTTAGHGGGGHHGLIGGNTVRMLGDTLDQTTGSPGWVMRLRMLNHLGAAAGRFLLPGAAAAAVGTIGYKAYQGNAQAAEALGGLRGAMGEGMVNGWRTNLLTKGLVSMLPAAMQPEDVGPRAQATSLEGMREQRGQIQDEVANVQKNRGYWQTYGSRLSGFGGRDNVAEGLDAEVKAQDQLLQLDQKIAGVIKQQTAIRQQGVHGSEREAELAQHRLDAEQKIAELQDKMRDGKIGLAEGNAQRKQILAEQGLDDFTTNQQFRGRAIDLARDRRMTSIQASGNNVEVRSAQAEFQAAVAARHNASTAEDRRQADVRVNQSRLALQQAQRSRGSRLADLDFQGGIANLSGSAQDQSQKAAAAEVMHQRALARFAHTDEEKTAAQNAIDAALHAQRGNTMELAAGRIDRSAASRISGNNVALSRYRLSLNTGSMDDNIRFAASQAGERAEARGAVADAQIRYNAARSKAQSELKTQGGVNEETLQAAKQAQQELNAAKLAQLETEKKLTQEARERDRLLKTELLATQNQTAASRLENYSGRGDLATVFQGRADSQAQALELERSGKHGQAQEILKQQQLREVGMIDDKYLNADGTRKNPGKIHAEELKQRVAQHRRERFNTQLERNGGLMNVRRDTGGHLLGGTDPLTHQYVTARELAQRQHSAATQAAKEKAGDSKSFKDIWDILDKRLPK